VEPNPGPPMQQFFSDFLKSFTAGEDLTRDIGKIEIFIKTNIKGDGFTIYIVNLFNYCAVPYDAHTEDHVKAFFESKTEKDIENIVGLAFLCLFISPMSSSHIFTDVLHKEDVPL
jgi:hypothetical protein